VGRELPPAHPPPLLRTSDRSRDRAAANPDRRAGRRAGAPAVATGPCPPTRSLTMDFNKSDTALVIIDPQNDVLSEKGVSWGLVGESIKENNTVENLERLFRAAKDGGFGVFISPHYLYPADQGWGFGGAVEKMMLEGKE